MTDDDVVINTSLIAAYQIASSGRGPCSFFGDAVNTLYDVEPEPWMNWFMPLSAKGFYRVEISIMRKKGDFLVFGAPAIEQPEIDEVLAVMQSGWLGTGPLTARAVLSQASGRRAGECRCLGYDLRPT